MQKAAPTKARDDNEIKREREMLFLQRPSFVVILLVFFVIDLTSTVVATTDPDVDRENESSTKENDTDNIETDFIFLQKFPLMNSMNLIFHTEVISCNSNQFTKDDQEFLHSQLNTMVDQNLDYVPIDDEFWSSSTKSNISCVEYGYGGSACTKQCCSVPHTSKQLHYPFNNTDAIIHNADTTQKSLYFYGLAHNMTRDIVWSKLCGGGSSNDDSGGEDATTTTGTSKCWSNWAGIDYNPLTNNCNTFTSTVLKCIYGLSDKKPHLGPSDTVRVSCDQCPPPTTSGSPLDSLKSSTF